MRLRWVRNSSRWHALKVEIERRLRSKLASVEMTRPERVESFAMIFEQLKRLSKTMNLSCKCLFHQIWICCLQFSLRVLELIHEAAFKYFMSVFHWFFDWDKNPRSINLFTSFLRAFLILLASPSSALTSFIRFDIRNVGCCEFVPLFQLLGLYQK